jgi:hypothetical protein
MTQIALGLAAAACARPAHDGACPDVLSSTAAAGPSASNLPSAGAAQAEQIDRPPNKADGQSSPGTVCAALLPTVSLRLVAKRHARNADNCGEPSLDLEIPELHFSKEICAAACRPYSFDTAVVKQGELIRYQCTYDLLNKVGTILFEPERLVIVSVDLEWPTQKPVVQAETLCASAAQMHVPGRVSGIDAVTH